MSRNARNQMETTFFHNMTQGINKEYIFNEDRCKKKYMELIKENAKEFDIEIINFTIMDNHAHILLYTENVNNMSLFMKNINGKFAMYYNYINERVGIVFRNRYKSQPIFSEEQLRNCIRYIFYNPVRAKIVLSPEKYVYSNFKEFQINDVYDNIFKKKNIQFYQENNTENIIAKSDFIDTCEDKKTFVKEFIRSYEKEHNITIYSDKKEIENMVKYVKKETNTSNIMLGEILKLSKSTITYYLKK